MTIITMNENDIYAMSKEQLEEVQDEMLLTPCLTDYEIYLYELIDKRLSELSGVRNR